MQYKIFSIPVVGSPELEDELNHFIRAHRVIAVQKLVEQVSGMASWCFCVEYHLGSGRGASSSGKGMPLKKERIDYREVLSEEDFAVYAKLRERRKSLAETETIPVYSVCTNAQMAQMATDRPTSLKELQQVEGFGEARLKKYGVALLEVIQSKVKENDAETEVEAEVEAKIIEAGNNNTKSHDSNGTKAEDGSPDQVGG
jgi:superfamily II DNA helicase RecQ